jgi:hypothetical protein
MSNQQLAYRAFSVVKRENQDDWWSEIGGAFAHADGQGLNIVLHSLPISGKIVLRVPKAEEEPRQEAPPANNSRRRQSQR